MSGIYTQSRSLAVSVRGFEWTTPNGSPVPWTLPAIPGKQETTSFRSGVSADLLEVSTPDTSIFARSPGSPPDSSLKDTGHEFYSRTERLSNVSRPNFRFASGWNQNPPYELNYVGPLLHDLQPWGSLIYPAVPRLSAISDAAIGAKMLKAATPTRSEAGVNVALAELFHDGMPSFSLSLLKSRAHTLKSAGQDYLNVEFGWKPLVSDITKTVRALMKATAVIKQFERDSGRIVRRRFALPATTSVSESSSNPYAANYGVPLENYGFGRKGAIQLVSSSEVSYWFSGTFTYYVATDSSVLTKLERWEQLGNKLLGTRLTPDVLWELMPWSWLIDWFTSVGDSIANVVAFQNDGLVMPYGYMMRKTRITTVATGTLLHRGISSLVVPFSNTFLVEQKERVKATPYGFGLSLDALSIRQWAILTALGLTRAPSRL